MKDLDAITKEKQLRKEAARLDADIVAKQARRDETPQEARARVDEEQRQYLQYADNDPFDLNLKSKLTVGKALFLLFILWFGWNALNYIIKNGLG